MPLKKITIIGFIWIFLWAASLIYYYARLLDHPYVFTHYQQISMEDDGYTFPLYYLVNANQDVYIRHIEVPGLDNANPVDVDIDEYPIENFQYQTMKSVALHLPKNSLVPAEIKKLQIFFSDDSVQETDIGWLRFLKDQTSDGLLDFRSGSSSSTGSYTYTLQAVKHGTITHITIDPPVLTPEEISLSLNGTRLRAEAFPIAFQAQKFLYFTGSFHDLQNSKKANAYYRVSIQLYLQDQQGNTCIASFPLSYEPNLDEKRLREMLEERRER